MNFYKQSVEIEIFASGTNFQAKTFSALHYFATEKVLPETEVLMVVEVGKPEYVGGLPC